MRIDSILNMPSAQQSSGSGGMLNELVEVFNKTRSANNTGSGNNVLSAINSAMGTDFKSADEAKSYAEFMNMFGMDTQEAAKTKQATEDAKKKQEMQEWGQLASTLAELAKGFKTEGQYIHQGKGGNKVYGRK